MKKLFLILSAMTVSAAASAQFSNSYEPAVVAPQAIAPAPPASTFSFVQPGQSFNEFHFTYSPTAFKVKNPSQEQKVDVNSLSAGYLRNISISNSNFYFNLGFDLRYSWSKNSDSQGSYSYTVTENFFDIKVPFGIMYKLNFGKVAFAPYIGFDADIFAIGNTKTTTTYGGTTQTDTEDMFKNSDFHRFVFGWHAGARIFINKFFFGVGYEGPVSNFYSTGNTKGNFHYCNIFLGFAF